MPKQFQTVKEVFEHFGWCKNAFARDSNNLGIPAINNPPNSPQPVAFSLTGAIRFVYKDATPTIYQVKAYLHKHHKHPFTIDEWQDHQKDFSSISNLIEELGI